MLTLQKLGNVMNAVVNRAINTSIRLVGFGGLVISLMFVMNLSAKQANDSLKGIKNFRAISEQLASSGMPNDTDLSKLKNEGFMHVISLIPGEFKDERATVESLHMSFEQIEVDWNQPKLRDFEKFVGLMKQYGNDKVLLHCRLNYRATAFAYLYQVTQKGVPRDQAMKTMHSVWHPEGVWLEFIESVLQHYQR
jgi:protein tyrosine phosphatase (PTP) superfamily phosphohydrolase (DUF442 family)